MKRKYTKLIMMLMLIIMSWWLYSGISILIAIILSLFVSIGMLIVELREAKRYLDVTLRRIFVCVDFDSASELANSLKPQLVYGFLADDVIGVTTQWLSVYQGTFEEENQVIYGSRIFKMARRWSEYALAYASVIGQTPFDKQKIDAISSYISTVNYGFEERLHDIIKLRSKPFGQVEINKLRVLENNNLHMAELTYLLAVTESRPEKKAYYLKAVENLAPKTFFNHTKEVK